MGRPYRRGFPVGTSRIAPSRAHLSKWWGTLTGTGRADGSYSDPVPKKQQRFQIALILAHIGAARD
ncbi:hypothetical protein APED_19855 [Acanthopleuribacter pedis]